MSILKHKTVEVVDHVATGAEAKQLRNTSGLSLREVARRLGYSAAYLSDLEKGRRNWSTSLALRYASALDSGRVYVRTKQ